MDVSTEFRECFEELSELRTVLLESSNSQANRLLRSSMELAQNQLSCLEVTNDFFSKFCEKSLEQNLESGKSLVMPDRDSVSSLKRAANASLGILEEVATKEENTDVALDAQIADGQKTDLNQLLRSDFTNKDFNNDLGTVLKYYKNQENDFDDSSFINTIVSEDVSASSPI